jgi:hypothetical protein
MVGSVGLHRHLVSIGASLTVTAIEEVSTFVSPQLVSVHHAVEVNILFRLDRHYVTNHGSRFYQQTR